MKGICIFIGLVLFMAAPCACKSRPAGPAIDSGEGKDMTGNPEAAAVEEGITAEAAQEESKQRCLGEFLGVEAKRRGMERALEPMYLEARHQGMLIDIIDLVTERAEEAKYEGTETAVEELTRGIVPEQELSDIKNVIKNRLTAHGSCMAVASRDDSACKAIKAEWDDGGQYCYMAYGIYVLVALHVLTEGNTCEEAFVGFKQFNKEDNLALCEAMLQQKPELCPSEDLSNLNVYCQVAASRARLNICSQGKFETPERDIFCCELFGWRFSSAVSGAADPYVIPEAGAMAGDKKGCTRSLTWGLLGDLGPMFGYLPAEAGDADDKEKSGHYLCTLEIHWSTQEIP